MLINEKEFATVCKLPEYVEKGFFKRISETEFKVYPNANFDGYDYCVLRFNKDHDKFYPVYVGIYSLAKEIMIEKKNDNLYSFIEVNEDYNLAMRFSEGDKFFKIVDDLFKNI